MNFVKDLNNRQSLWQTNDGSYLLCSTSHCGTEIMIFQADSQGNVTEWLEEYVDYSDTNNHTYHANVYAGRIR